jgi:integrase/recombinase XerD
MTRNFRKSRKQRQKAQKIRTKSLATKLAILFRGKRNETVRMHASHQPERSLFGINGSRKYLNVAEQKRFKQAVQTLPPEQRLFCTVLALSGGRISEVLSLTPNAVDFESGDIALKTLKRRKQGVIRQIPLPLQIMCEFESQFRIGTARFDPQLGDRPIWSWSRTTAWRLIKRIMETADIVGPAASPKGLRHTFGVSAFQSNVPPHLVQRWLGHASLRTTTIYAEVSGEEERQFAARMWDAQQR